MANFLTMTDPNLQPPVVLKRRIGAALKGLRKAADLNLDEMALYAEITKSSLSRYESGHTAPKLHVLRALWAAYESILPRYGTSPSRVLGPDGPTLPELEEMAKQAIRPGWRVQMFGEGTDIPEWLETYVGLEATATRLCIYDFILPGLFQTTDYARIVIAGTGREGRQLESRVRLRELRRQLLTDDGEHPTVHVVLDESVVRRQVADPGVMRAQMRHLASLAKLPHITVQIAPFDRGVTSASMGAGFALLEFEADPPVVYLESQVGHYIQDADEVERFRLAFAALAEGALSPDASAEVFADAGREG